MVRARSGLAAEQSRGSHGCATGHTLAWGRSSATANCWASDACFNGLWIEAEDASGKPFVATSRVLAGPAGDGGYGSQWVRDGLPYPYPHG
jgi:hypothetical protein